MEPLLTIRTLINNKIGIINIKIHDEDIIIILEHPPNEHVIEYIFDYSMKTTKFKDLIDCICEMPEVSAKKSGYDLNFVIESADKVKYTSAELFLMPINKIPKGIEASLLLSLI